MMAITEQTEEILQEDAPAPQAVAKRTAISGSWMLAARLISRVLDFGTMLVLARLLVPADFGLVAIAASLVAILEAALELPLSQALVRLPKIEPHYYDTAFTLSLIRASLLAISLCAVSVPFAHIYHDPRLVPLICFLGLAPAARGMVSPRLADYAKSLDFSKDFYIEFTGKVTALALAISIALIYRTYWSIAVATITSPLIGTITSYVISPYRPRISLSGFRAFSGFLGWTTAAQVISAVNWQSDRLLLGKLVSKSTLGLFTTANDMGNIPLQTFFGPLIRPLLSAFTLVREDSARLARSYQTSSTAMVTLGLPILVGEALVAEPAIRLMFGHQWYASVPMLRWIAISLIPALFAVPFAPLVMSLDRTRYFLIRNSFELFVKIPLVVVGAIKYQFFGVIFARLISETAVNLFCILIVRKLIGLSPLQQLLAPWRSAAGAVAMALALAPCVQPLTSARAMAPLAAGLLLTVLIGAVSYAGTVLLLWNWQGRPDGLESLLVRHTQALLRGVGGKLVKTPA